VARQRASSISMRRYEEVAQHHVTSFENDGRTYEVTVRIIYDGIEYVGRLWFMEESWEDDGAPDRASLPGRTQEEVMALATRLTDDELRLRLRRALAEKRRYKGLRRATDEIISKIRYLNQVVLSMRAGLLDVEGAGSELDLTEQQLHECVARLREFAGKEEEERRPVTGDREPGTGNR
jgi:hypothetical protein